MMKLRKLSLSLIVLLVLNVPHIKASSFSEIELLETNEMDEIDFSFCFNEHYNDINISYLNADQITQCFFNSSKQLHILYCNSKSPHLLNDLISGLEYTLSWLNRIEHYSQAQPTLVNKQKQQVKALLNLAPKHRSKLCQEYQR